MAIGDGRRTRPFRTRFYLSLTPHFAPAVSGSSGALLPRRPLRTGRADHFAPGSSHSPAPRCDTGLPGGMFRVLTVGEVGIPCGIERVRQRRDFGVPLD